MAPRDSVRRLLYLTEKSRQRRRFAATPDPRDGWPIVLGISFPKSGTHLLDQILLGFAKIGPFSLRLHSFYAEYEGDSGRKRTPEQALVWLGSLQPLDVASAHLFASSGSTARVCSSAFLPYFIFRDPRDVAVSHVFYVAEMESAHVHHAYYQSLPDFDARLRTSILGRPDAEIEFPDIAARFAPYMGWLDHPEVLKIHFEELVNERLRTLQLITDHFLRRVPISLPRETIVEALESSINPDRSPTFRSGKTGEWRKYFTPEDKVLFKETAGDLLIKLGYESSHGW